MPQKLTGIKKNCVANSPFRVNKKAIQSMAEKNNF